MPHHRADVLAHAVELLDTHGLSALTMRRLGTELGVQPSAIYHHFENKQTLLAAVADEILARGPGGGEEGSAGRDASEQLGAICRSLREAMLAVTDGADVVATAWAFGLGAQAPARQLERVLTGAGAHDELVAVASRTLLHYVFGHTFEEQTALQAISAGAVDRAVDSIPDFDLGLGLVLDGLRARLGG